MLVQGGHGFVTRGFILTHVTVKPTEGRWHCKCLSSMPACNLTPPLRQHHWHLGVSCLIISCLPQGLHTSCAGRPSDAKAASKACLLHRTPQLYNVGLSKEGHGEPNQQRQLVPASNLRKPKNKPLTLHTAPECSDTALYTYSRYNF